VRRALAVATIALVAGCGGSDETDRGRLAFVRDGQLVLLPPDRAKAKRVTPADPYRFVIERNPAWSPDGRRIAFVSDRGRRPLDNLYVVDAAGGEPRQITDDFRVEIAPVWIDDDTIAFASCTLDFAACDLAHVKVSSKRRDTLRGVFPEPLSFAASRDGETIVYTRRVGGGSDVYSVDAEGGNVRRLTRTRGHDRDASVSDDGARIAFASERDGFGRCFGTDCTDAAREIYVMRADGSEQRRLTRDARDDASPSWSPDGEQIVWSRWGGSERGYSELWVMNADGTCPRKLTSNPGKAIHPAYEPAAAPGRLEC
jgi:Tol biopolymer transport system component